MVKSVQVMAAMAKMPRDADDMADTLCAGLLTSVSPWIIYKSFIVYYWFISNLLVFHYGLFTSVSLWIINQCFINY